MQATKLGGGGSMIELFASAGALLLLDQWSKRMVRRHLLDRSISCGRILRLTYVTHSTRSHARAGFRVALAVVWVAALTSAIVLHRQGSWFETPIALLGLGLALGGAAGNLLDI